MFRENWSIGGSKLGTGRNIDTRTDRIILRALLGACENGLLAVILLFVRPAEWVVVQFHKGFYVTKYVGKILSQVKIGQIKWSMLENFRTFMTTLITKI
jgi:hypothetical protein